MDGSTHFPIGFALGWSVAAVHPAWLAASPVGSTMEKTHVVMAAACGVAALLADLEHPKAILGRLFFFLPAVKKFNGPGFPPKVGRRIPFTKIVIWHRGPTHSLVAAGAAFLISFLTLLFSGHGALAWPLSLVVLVGYLSHLAADTLNYSPQSLFWLLPERVVTHRVINGAKTIAGQRTVTKSSVAQLRLRLGRRAEWAMPWPKMAAGGLGDRLIGGAFSLLIARDLLGQIGARIPWAAGRHL